MSVLEHRNTYLLSKGKFDALDVPIAATISVLAGNNGGLYFLIVA